MVDVDTSSYKLPVQKTFPEQIAQWQNVASNDLTINKQKLDNANQALGYMTRAMGSLGPDATKDQYLAVGQNAVKLGLVPPDMLNTYSERVAAAPDAKSFYNEFMTAAAGHQEQLDYHLGKVSANDNGQQVTPTLTSPKPGFSPTGAVKPAGLPVQQQLPPGTPTVTPSGAQLLGPQPAQVPPGMAPAPGGLPGQGTPVQAPKALPVGPVTSPAIQGPSANFGGNVVAANVEPPTPQQRIDSANYTPRGPMTSQPPLFDEGKNLYTKDQDLATSRMTAVKPAMQALKLMPGLRSGPGTEPFNKAVAFLKANNIITTAQENDPTAVYQEVTKKLANYVGGSSLAARSDAGQALAEAGSPSPKTQIAPALTKLTRDAIIQDRVQAARPNAFQGNNYADYGKHSASFPQSIDERAFGLDLMDKAESTKLVDTMANKYKKNPKDPEALKFFSSLDIAKKQGFFNQDTQ